MKFHKFKHKGNCLLFSSIWNLEAVLGTVLWGLTWTESRVTATLQPDSNRGTLSPQVILLWLYRPWIQSPPLKSPLRGERGLLLSSVYLRSLQTLPLSSLLICKQGGREGARDCERVEKEAARGESQAAAVRLSKMTQALAAILRSSSSADYHSPRVPQVVKSMITLNCLLPLWVSQANYMARNPMGTLTLPCHMAGTPCCWPSRMTRDCFFHTMKTVSRPPQKQAGLTWQFEYETRVCGKTCVFPESSMCITHKLVSQQKHKFLWLETESCKTSFQCCVA